MEIRAERWGTCAVVAIGLLCCPVARAEILELPEHLAPLVLSETVPFTFRPNGYSAADYRLEWAGPPVPGLGFRLGEKSLDWVRVGEILDLPRGLVMLQVENAEGAVAIHGGVTHPFVRASEEQNGSWTALVPVALLSGKSNPLEIRVRRGGRELQGMLVVRLAPQKGNEAQILFDPTCSVPDVRANVRSALRPETFVYVGGRQVRIKGDQYPHVTQELWVYWDDAGPTLRVDGVSVPSVAPGLWVLRGNAKPGIVEIQNGGEMLRLSYSVPERFRKVSLGFGVGPYAYAFRDGRSFERAFAPLVTVYGAYSMSEVMRITTFNATAIHDRWYTNQGLYLWSEQMRVFDSRFSMVLLLGLDVLVFRTRGADSGLHWRVGGPQGIEFTFRDFPIRRHDVSFGAFVAPKLISEQFYTNAWVRWGPPEWFVEFNYLAWQEELPNELVYSRSMGISVGMPLARLL